MIIQGTAIIALSMLALYAVLRVRLSWAGTFLPDGFLLGLLLFMVGGWVVASREGSSEAMHIALIGNMTLLSGVVGAGFGLCLVTAGYRSSISAQVRRSTLPGFDRMFSAGALVGVILVTSLFVYLVITGPATRLVGSVAGLATEGSLLELRKTVGSGRGPYLAPGYVKQFRDVLGPVLVVYLGWCSFRGAKILRGLLVVFLVTAMVLSGQRAPLLILLLALVAGDYLARRAEGASFRRLIGYGALGVSFLLILTAVDALLGRIGSDTISWTLPLDTFAGLVDRAIVEVPRANAATMDVWGPLAPTLGASWMRDLSAALPGPASQMLSNLLHVAGGGSREGNLVLGMASDLWLAWGWLGVIIVPAIYAVFTCGLDVALFRSGSRVALATRTYLFFALPIIYSPYGFLLYGGGVALLVLTSAAAWKSLGALSREGGRDRPLGGLEPA